MYNTLTALHIIFAGIWLSSFLLDLFIKRFNGRDAIGYYLILSNISGMIGSLGILLTGIVITIINPAYNFFQFTANHWLTTKQFIMIILLLLIFLSIIPRAKLLRQSLSSAENKDIPEKLNKLMKATNIMNWLVLLNMLLALSHRYMV